MCRCVLCVCMCTHTRANTVEFASEPTPVCSTKTEDPTGLGIPWSVSLEGLRSVGYSIPERTTVVYSFSNFITEVLVL